MKNAEMEVYAREKVAEYCRDIGGLVGALADLVGLELCDDDGMADYMEFAVGYIKPMGDLLQALGGGEWISLAGVAPGIELLDYLQQELFDQMDYLVMARLRSHGSCSKEAVRNELEGALGAMKAVKGMILETSFDWYRDNFLGLVDVGNVVWRHRGWRTM